VVELDEARAAFDEAAGEEAVAAEGGRVLFDAVEFERGFALFAEVDQLGALACMRLAIS
jgi:hypothetical protein